MIFSRYNPTFPNKLMSYGECEHSFPSVVTILLYHCSYGIVIIEAGMLLPHKQPFTRTALLQISF